MTTPTAQQVIDKAKAFLADQESKTYLATYATAVQRASTRSGWDPASGTVSDAQAIGAFFQYLWEELPDVPSIRRKPFYTICDIAELYCFHMAELYPGDVS